MIPIRKSTTGWPHPEAALANMRQRHPPFERTIPFFNDQSMDGKHIIITGAASIMGRVMAVKLANLGVELTLVDRDEVTLINFAAVLMAACRRPDTQWRFAICDMTRPHHVSRILSRAVARAGECGIEALVNCVGCNGSREHDHKYAIKKRGTVNDYTNIKDRVENMFEELDMPVPEGFIMKVAEAMHHNPLHGGSLHGGSSSHSGSLGVISLPANDSVNVNITANVTAKGKTEEGQKASTDKKPADNNAKTKVDQTKTTSDTKKPASLGKLGGEMLKSRRGAIVNIVGESEIQTMADHRKSPPPKPFHLYNDTALVRELWRTVQMTRKLAQRLAPVGISVNGVSAGKMSIDNPDSVNKYMKWGRVAPAEEIAEMVMGFLRESSGTIYGQIRTPDPVKLGDLMDIHI